MKNTQNVSLVFNTVTVDHYFLTVFNDLYNFCRDTVNSRHLYSCNVTNSNNIVRIIVKRIYNSNTKRYIILVIKVTIVQYNLTLKVDVDCVLHDYTENFFHHYHVIYIVKDHLVITLNDIVQNLRILNTIE